MLNKSSITLKFSLVYILSIALIGGAYFLLVRNVYEAQLVGQARTVADHVEAFGAWVSKHGRIWAKDNPSSFLGQLEVVEAASLESGELKPAIFYSKNPALAQREFSETVAESDSAAKFRMTSDNFMNPLNKPDRFEADAIQIVKKQGLDEYSSLGENQFRYARVVYHNESCIACHGSAENAPTEVTSKYGTRNGFGFKTGDVAGIISVTLPTQALLTSLIEFITPVEIALVLLAFILPYLYIRMGVVNPVHTLTRIADKLSMGQQPDVKLKSLDQRSRNEIHQLTMAVYRLRQSMMLAIQKMRNIQQRGNRE